MEELLSLNRQLDIKVAREKFLANPATIVQGIRPEIRDSWHRSLHAGVNPLRSASILVKPTTFSQNFLFEILSHPSERHWLQELKSLADESNHLVVLADDEGYIRHIEGSVKLRNEAANRLLCQEGTCWLENLAGTNALGAALQMKRPIEVIGNEHFCETAENWICMAAPIFHPVTHQVLGAIDMTGNLKDMHPHSMIAVIAMTRAIEELLEKKLQYERFLILERYTENIMKNSIAPLIAVDRCGYLIKATPSVYHLQILHKDTRRITMPVESSCSNWEMAGQQGTWFCTFEQVFHENVFVGGMIHLSANNQKMGFQKSLSYPRDKEITPVTEFQNRENDSFLANILGISQPIICARELARNYAAYELPVLILGETGTGKELFAKSIHANSSRRDKQFIAINCSAIPRELAPSEFFGYVGGAFTGAIRTGKKGKFELANGGTIFLDEISAMPLELQPYLLRVLEEKEVTPLGANQSISLDVRVIAASNRDLLKAAVNGTFREDLYYRLNTLTLHLPSLRERETDIPFLIDHFLHKAALELKREILHVEPQVLTLLSHHSWPGNVRELRNVVYQMVARMQFGKIILSDLPKEWVFTSINAFELANENRHFTKDNSERNIKIDHSIAHQENLHCPYSDIGRFSNKINTLSDDKVSLRELGMKMIIETIAAANGNVSEAAKRLGVSRSTIYRKLARMKE